jgi:hypothetical protein
MELANIWQFHPENCAIRASRNEAKVAMMGAYQLSRDSKAKAGSAFAAASGKGHKQVLDGFLG